MKCVKVELIIVMEKGRIIWEIDVELFFMFLEVGYKYELDDVFCYIVILWNIYDRVLVNFSGCIIEVCVK